MTHKTGRIAALVDELRGRDLDPHYLGYFECFNRQLYFEAHEVLEAIWLPDRQGPNGAFYKGLIQLAGAFVHLQKNRVRPAAALFKLAESNLKEYPAWHKSLGVAGVVDLIQEWLAAIEASAFESNPLLSLDAPRLELIGQE